MLYPSTGVVPPTQQGSGRSEPRHALKALAVQASYPLIVYNTPGRVRLNPSSTLRLLTNSPFVLDCAYRPAMSESVSVCIHLLVLILVGIILWSRHKSKRNLYPKPPGPKGYPLIGNLLDIPTDQEHVTFAAWKK